MRVKPVAPVLGIQARVDATIAGTRIPAGTDLLLLTRHAAMQEESFSRPREFDPQRWLERGEAPGAVVREPTAFLPFGAGPRFCPGRNLALLEAKAVLAMLARNFEVQLDRPDEPVTEVFAFTMAPKNLRVRLQSRR